MLNTLAILLSCGAIVFVIIRAMVLDRSEPWFGGEKEEWKKGRKRPGRRK